MLAEWTGLEPATPGVTGRYSNQLNYHSKAMLSVRRRCYSATLVFSRSAFYNTIVQSDIAILACWRASAMPQGCDRTWSADNTERQFSTRLR